LWRHHFSSTKVKTGLKALENFLWHGFRVVEAPNREATGIRARALAKELGYRYIGFAVEKNTIPGFETTAYKLEEDFTPDIICVPVGGANNLVALGRAYLEMEKQGDVEQVPQLYAVQSSACSPIVGEFTGYVKGGLDLSGGRHRTPNREKREAVSLVRKTEGTGQVMREKEILKANAVLTSNGIYTSPTGAVATAGAIKARLRRKIVCIVTDTGLESNMMMEKFKKRTFKIENEQELGKLMETLRGT